MPAKSKSLTSTRSGEKTPPLHPGVIRPLGIPSNALALALHVPVTRIPEIVNERRGVTADTALRLARYFKMPSDFWMNLQTQYELETVEDEHAASIRREICPVLQDRRTGQLKQQATA